MICLTCQTINRADAYFCRHCGALLAGRCPRCGTTAQAHSNYCDHCGLPLAPHVQVALTPTRSAGGVPAPIPISASTMEDRPTLQQYIPKELLAKLEAARARNTMLGERRIVTMLFCDVKGSTRAAEELDPEDWSEVINAAFEFMIRPVYQFEGMVARLMGDGILAFFGAPIAHEDDPQRAVMAGLEIVQGLGAFRGQVRSRWGIDLDVRVGINTGLVVVGAVGSDLRVEYTALGDAINLAARMEQSAQPGTVQVAEATHRLIAAHFEFVDLGEIVIKGKDRPVHAYRVFGPRISAHSEHNLQQQTLPLVGRSQELAMLSRMVDRVLAGNGAIVAVIGEAGLGKTRLVHEAIDASRTRPAGQADCHEIAAVSYESMQAYGLVQRLVRHALEISVETREADVLARVMDAVAGLGNDTEAKASSALLSLLGLTVADGQLALEGEVFKHQLFTATEAIWLRRMRERPLLLVLEDLHWADSASLDLLRYLFQLAEREAVLFVAVLRPDRASAAWRMLQAIEADHVHLYAEIALRPLSEDDSNALLKQSLGTVELPPQLDAAILAKAEGNPLFVEEIVRALLEQDGLGRAAGLQAGTALNIPGTLQALLTARMDRLNDQSRHVLQLASVLGRTFNYRVLSQLIDDSGDDLDERLIELQRLGLIRESARRPEREYSFQQSLVQEVVYGTILLRQRRKIHAQAARATEAVYVDRLADLAPVLAHHYDEAAVPDRAAEYYLLSGKAALRLYATSEALVHFDRALNLVQEFAVGSNDLIADIYRERGHALELCSRFDEALDNYLSFERVALSRGDRRAELAALLAQGRIHATINPLYDPARVHDLAERARILAYDIGDQAAEAEILWNLMNQDRFATEHMERGIVYGERALELARGQGALDLLPYVVNDLADSYGLMGEFRRALTLYDEARGYWRQLGNEAMLADCLVGSGIYTSIMGDYDQALRYVDEALAISQRIGNIWGQAYGRGMRGWVACELGQFDQAVDELTQAIADAEEAGFLFGQVYSRMMLAVAYGELGMGKAALDTVSAANLLATGKVAQLAMLAQALQLYVSVRFGEPDASLATRLSAESAFERRSNVLEIYFWSLALTTWALHQGKAEDAVALSDRLIEHSAAIGARAWAIDGAALRAEALHRLGRHDEALSQLRKATEQAESIGLQRAFWHLLVAQADLEETRREPVVANALRVRARMLVQQIVSQISDPDHRKAFVGQPDVRRLLD